jgi:hypothetical protein
MVEAGAVEARQVFTKIVVFMIIIGAPPIKRETANDQVSLHTCTRAKSGCGKL